MVIFCWVTCHFFHWPVEGVVHRWNPSCDSNLGPGARWTKSWIEQGPLSRY